MSTEVVLRPDPQLETDEPDVAHVVMTSDWEVGYLHGQPIRALCGIEFIPSKVPDGLPLCKPCKEKRDQILAAMRGAN